jgi:hypothetical protein
MFAASIIRAMMTMEAASTAETSVNFYQTAECNIPEGGSYSTVVFIYLIDGNIGR